jgi:hypothetical protein
VKRIYGVVVDSLNGISDSLRRSGKIDWIHVLAHDGPALADVVSARQELIMPPKTTIDEAWHFGLFMMKAVMDGRGGELIDLAKVNLTR